MQNSMNKTVISVFAALLLLSSCSEVTVEPLVTKPTPAKFEAEGIEFQMSRDRFDGTAEIPAEGAVFSISMKSVALWSIKVNGYQPSFDGFISELPPEHPMPNDCYANYYGEWGHVDYNISDGGFETIVYTISRNTTGHLREIEIGFGLGLERVGFNITQSPVED